jgi:hypothetical protein
MFKGFSVPIFGNSTLIFSLPLSIFPFDSIPGSLTPFQEAGDVGKRLI